MNHPTWFDWITVAAIVAGPVLALFAQRALDYLREKQNQRLQLYLTLMSLRSTPLHPDHVKALNAIDTTFDSRGEKHRKVRDAWDLVLRHVATERGTTEQAQTTWDNRLTDLRVDLYQAVGRAVGYEHSIEYLKSHHYMPTYFINAELEWLYVRGMLTKALTEHGIKVLVTEPPAAGPAAGHGQQRR